MFHCIIEEISREQERKKKKFSDIDLPLPLSSTDLYNTNMISDRQDNELTDSRSVVDPMGADTKDSAKRRKRNNILQTEDDDNEMLLNVKVPFWRKCCKLCGV